MSDTERIINHADGLAIAAAINNLVTNTTVDSALSTTSEHPVQNKIVTAAINANATAISGKQDALSSSNTLPITSGGTGASDASTARTNLGLGTAAVANTTTSIASASTDVPTSGTVYSYTAPVVITSSSSSAPSDTRSLWVYPAS